MLMGDRGKKAKKIYNMRRCLSILLIISSLNVLAGIPTKRSFCNVKIYAMRFTVETRTRVKENDIKGLSTLVKKIKDKESLEKICEGLNQLKSAPSSPGDIRMMFTVHYSP